MHTLPTNTMLTLEICRKVLNEKKNLYNEYEVIQIRDYLYLLADLQLEAEAKNNN